MADLVARNGSEAQLLRPVGDHTRWTYLKLSVPARVRLEYWISFWRVWNREHLRQVQRPAVYRRARG
jgi:hypothetical protein